jgi:hypothetical protein
VGISYCDLHAGQIVWATVRDPRGYRKRRPVIILTPDAEILPDRPLALMAVTTSFPDPPPPDCIELPWNPDPRRVGTGLAQRSAVVVTWMETAYPDEIDGVIGAVPKRLLAEIHRRIARENQ